MSLLEPDDEFNVYHGKTRIQVKKRERKILITAFIIIFVFYAFGLYSYLIGEISVRGNQYILEVDPSGFYFSLLCILIAPTICFLGSLYRYYIIIDMHCKHSE